MDKKTIFVIVEPAKVTPVWYEKGITGLKETAFRQRFSVQFINHINDLENYSEKIHSIIIISSRIDWTQQIINSLRTLHIRSILIGTIPGMFGEDISGAILNHTARVFDS